MFIESFYVLTEKILFALKRILCICTINMYILFAAVLLLSLPPPPPPRPPSPPLRVLMTLKAVL